MASIWKLPVLFVCENNEFATEVPFQYASGNPSVAGRAKGYGLPGVEVDGNDVLAVWEAAHEAVGRARRGEGATLIECKTYRWRAHTERKGQPDPRDQKEVEIWKAKDPIAQLERRMRDQGVLDDGGVRSLDREVMGAIERAVAFAEASPFPAPAQATEDVFAA